MNKFISLFLGLSFFTTIFSYKEGSETLFHFISMFFLVLSGLLALTKIKYVLSTFDVFIFILVSLSLITSIMTGNLYSTQYTIVFLIYCFCFSFISTLLSTQKIVDIFIVALCFIIIIILIFDGADLLIALSVFTDSNGLFRFTPLGMHPNLTGLAYGGCAILLFFKFLNTNNNLFKFVFLALSIICFLFVIAASARASLLAIFFSFLIWLIKYIKNMNQTRLMYLITFSLFPIIIIFIKLDFITTFLIDILEINSESRGVSSGGTGRVSLWSQGVEIIFSDVFRFFFGGGLRSAGVDDIGLSLESSYLNLIFESGIIITVGFVVFFCLIVHKFTKLSDFNIENGTGLYYSIAMVLTFVFIQSIFNRYLISIGNFYSMFVFIMMFKASHIRKCRILIKF